MNANEVEKGNDFFMGKNKSKNMTKTHLQSNQNMPPTYAEQKNMPKTNMTKTLLLSDVLGSFKNFKAIIKYK